MCRFGRHDVRALDRRVEIEFALRDMARGAEIVIELRAAGVLDARREIHVVMAGAAGCARSAAVKCAVAWAAFDACAWQVSHRRTSAG